MRAGGLTQPISILEPYEVKDEYGATKTEYKIYLNTRADVTYSNGSRYVENDEIVNSYNYIFRIRGYHRINEKMIILWKWGKYRIESIDETTKQIITITTSLINE